MQGVYEADRSQPMAAVNLSIAHDKLGAALLAKGDRQPARQHFNESMKILAEVPERQPLLEYKLRFTCMAHFRLVTIPVGEDSGTPAEIAESRKNAIAACGAWAALKPNEPERATMSAKIKALP